MRPLVLFAATVLSATAAAEDPSGVEHGNVLLIVADDIAVADLACYDPSATRGLTPNLDRLAADGIVFDRAWSTPLCSATRALLLTGKHAYRTGIGNVVEKGSVSLAPSATTIPEALRAYANASYASAAFGKWHREARHSRVMCPPTERHGFDAFAGTLRTITGSYCDWLPVIGPPPATRTRDGSRYMLTVLAERATEWLAQQTTPWFVYFAPQSPYDKLHVPPRTLQTRVEGEVCTPCEEGDRRCYEAAIQALDTTIGSLLDELGDDWGATTTVVFTADNGTPDNVRCERIPKRGKGTLYNDGVHVPLIVAGRGVGSGVRGTRSTALILVADLFRTTLGLAGARALPGDVAPDSRDLGPVLAGTAESTGRTTLLAERFARNADAPPYRGHQVAVRGERYKLIFDVAHDAPIGFFDIEADPMELDDLTRAAFDPEDASGAAAAYATLRASIPADVERTIGHARVTAATGGDRRSLPWWLAALGLAAGGIALASRRVADASAQPAPIRRARLFVAVATGWVLHDLAFYAASTEPRLALALVPASALALGAAVLVGAAWSRVPPLVPALAGVSLLAIVAIELGAGSPSATLRWLPRVLAALFVTASLCARVAALHAKSDEARRSEIAFGIGAGVLACIAVAWKRGAITLDSSGAPSMACATAALVLVASTGLRSGRSRRLACATVGVALTIAIALLARDATALRRPDQALARPNAETDRPNLLLVVLDTVRADHLASYGHTRVTTPALDAFASAHATRYANARSTSSWTLPSHASLFTGLQPDEHGATRPRSEDDPDAVELQAWPARRLRDDVPTLAGRLTEHGYRTAAFLANGSFLRHEYGLDRGFERYDDRKSAWHNRYTALAQILGHAARVGFLPYRDARTITDCALEWLNEGRDGAPFFLMLNYMDAHAPYLPHVSTRDAFGPEQPADLHSVPRELNPLQYDRELLYLDAQLARVWAALEELDLFDDTVVIVTSDHGEAFGEHGFTLHGWNLFDETLRVPLFVKSVGRGAPGVIEDAIVGAEIFDLALAELGLAARTPLASTQGPTMLGQLYLTKYLAGRWKERGVEGLSRHQVAWIEGDIKFHVGGNWRVTAFDVRQDPHELAPLELSFDEVDRAREHARIWWAAHPEVRTTTPEAEDSERDRLRDLGYTGDDD